MKKNIVFFIGNLDRSGGTERITSVIANELVKYDYNIIILSLQKGLNPFFKIDKNIKLYSLHTEERSSNFSNIYIIKNLHNFLKIYSIEYIIDVDIVLSFYSIPASFGLKTKIISWEHFHYFINVGGVFQRIKRKIARRLASRYSNTIVTLTNKDKNQYLKNLNIKGKIISINNPVTIKHNFQSNIQSKIVLAVGRLTYQKGFDLLLKSWKFVIQEIPDWELYIVGSGEDKKMLENLSRKLNIYNSVKFISKTNEIEKYYMNSSIYVMSSRFEGFGLVLVEAKSFGLPIVSFDINCGPSDIVRDNIDGFLVEKDNIKELAKKIILLIKNEKIRKTFSKNSITDRRFDINNIIPLWKDILK